MWMYFLFMYEFKVMCVLHVTECMTCLLYIHLFYSVLRCWCWSLSPEHIKHQLKNLSLRVMTKGGIVEHLLRR